MDFLMVYRTVACITIVNKLSNAEQNIIALTQSIAEGDSIKLTGNSGTQLDSFILLSPGFHAVLVGRIYKGIIC
jgi:hypothetical protein